MAKMEWTIEAQDNASRALDSANRSLNEMEGALGGATEASDGAADSTENFTDTTESGIGTLGKFGLAVNGVREAYNILAGTIGESIELRKEQLLTEGQIEFAMDRATDSIHEQERAMSALNQLSEHAQQNTVFAGGDVEASYARIVQITEDVGGAHDIARIAMDAATVAQQDLEKTSERLARVKEGEISAVRRMHILNREQIDDLNEIEDAAERGAAAMEMIAEQTDGAAESQDDYLIQSAKLGNDLDDLKASFGDVAIAVIEMANSIAEDGTIQWLSDYMGDLANDIRYLSVAWEEFSVGMEETGGQFMNPMARMEVGREAITWREHFAEEGQAARRFQGEVQSVDEYMRNRRGVTRDEAAIENLMGTDDMMGMKALEEEFERLAMSESEMADAIQRQRDIRAEMAKEVRAQREAEARAQREAAKQAEADEEARQEARERWLEHQKERAKVQAQIVAAEHEQAVITADTDQAREEAELARSILRIKERGHDTDLESVLIKNEELKLERQREQAASAQADEEAEIALERANRNDIAILRLQLLTEEDELVQAEIENQIELAQLDEDRLTSKELEFEQDRIEAEFKEREREIERQYEEERDARRQEYHQRQLDRQQEQFAQTQASLSAVAGTLNSFSNNPLTIIGGQAVSASHDFRQLADAGADAGEHIASALGSGADAVAQSARAMGAETEVIAGIQSAFEAAQSVAAFATGNVPGGVAHAGASAMFAAVAAGVGQGASASKGAGASSGAGSSNRPTQQDRFGDQGRNQEMMTEAHLEALREHDRGGQEIHYHLDQSNSSFFERETASQRKVQSSLADVGSLSYSTSSLNG